MREACGSPCSARERPFGTFQCFDRLIGEKSPTGAFFVKRSISSRFAASDNAGSLRLPLLRTETSLWDVPVFRSACGLRKRCGGPAGPPHPPGHKTLPSAPSVRRRVPKPPFRRTRRRTWGVQCEPQQARGTPPQSGSTPAGSPCSALKRPFGTFQCFDRLITEESPTGASFVKRSISNRFAASDNAGSLRLPLLRTETPPWDVPVFRSAYWRRKPHRGFLRQTLDLQPPCGLRQCGKPAAPLAPHGNVPLGRSSVPIGLWSSETMRGACGPPAPPGA